LSPKFFISFCLDFLKILINLKSIKSKTKIFISEKANLFKHLKMRRTEMDVKDYCNGVQMELTTWKARLYDITRKMEKLPGSDREKVLGNIGDMNNLLTEMEERVEKLEKECPTEWSPEKKDIDGAHFDVLSKYEETMEYIGKAASVSVPG
jgi:hypothetical protein